MLHTTNWSFHNFRKKIFLWIIQNLIFSYPKITTKRITAGGGIDSSEDIFIALSSLNICRINCGTFSFSLQTKIQGQHRSEVSFFKIRRFMSDPPVSHID